MLRVLRIKHIGSTRNTHLINQIIRKNSTNANNDADYLWKVAPDTETITSFPFGYFPWLSKVVKTQPIVRDIEKDIQEENLLNYTSSLFDFVHTSKAEREERIRKPTLSENVLESYILGEESEEKIVETEQDEMESEGEQEDDKELFKFNLNKFNKRADSADKLVTLNSIFSQNKENEKSSANALIENFFSTTAKKREEQQTQQLNEQKEKLKADESLETINVEELERARDETAPAPQLPEDSFANVPDQFAAVSDDDIIVEVDDETGDDEGSSFFNFFEDDYELLEYLEGISFDSGNTVEAQKFLKDVQSSKMNDFSVTVRERIAYLVRKARISITSHKSIQEFWDEFYVLRQLNEFDTLGAIHYRPIIESDVKETMFKLYQTNPEEWTMNKLAQKFRIKKLRVEAIIRLQIKEAILRRTQPWLVDDMEGEEIEFLYSEYYGFTHDGEWIAHEDDRTPMDDYRWRRAGLVAADETEDLAALHRLAYRIQEEWIELPEHRPRIGDGNHVYPTEKHDGLDIRGPQKKYSVRKRSNNLFIDSSEIENFEEECPMFYLRPDGSMRFVTWEERRWIFQRPQFSFKGKKNPSPTQDTLIDPVLFPTDAAEEKYLLEQRKPQWKNKRFAYQQLVTEDEILRTLDAEFNTVGKAPDFPKSTYIAGRIPWSVQHQMKVERQVNVLDTLYQPYHADY